MDTLIIGCKTLENELLQAVADCSCKYEIRWVESGLHNFPKKLNTVLQELLDNSQGFSRILMAMGYCGNSIAGLRTGDFTLILPRVDDCISLLLGSFKNRAALTKGDGTYFLTDGWLKGERNLWWEYRYTLDKYGEDVGKEIFQTMLRSYRSLALLDTGCYPLESAEEISRKIADTLGLRYKLLPATLEYLKQLLDGPWPENSFLTIPPFHTIDSRELTLPI